MAMDMKQLWSVFGLVLTIALSAPAQNILYVNSAATGGNDGTSWQNAFTDLPTALTQALPGQQIWVAKGVYRPTVDSDRTKSFVIDKPIQLYGGFAGTETLLAQRIIADNSTKLNGNIGDPALRTDNSFHVVTILDVDTACVLDGFIIEEGYADGSDGNPFGGGTFITNEAAASPTRPVFRNCFFRRNYAFYGGGVACVSLTSASATGVFDSCTFSFNTSQLEGAGFYKSGHTDTLNSLLIDRCSFTDNRSYFLGGAIQLSDTGPWWRISRTVFTRDTAIEGGALSIDNVVNQSKLNITQTSFLRNIASSTGGAFRLSQFYDEGFVLLLDSVDFVENRANVNVGGAVTISVSSTKAVMIDFQNCLFDRNRSVSPGAGIAYEMLNGNSKAKIKINNSCFKENIRTSTAHLGTAIYVVGGGSSLNYANSDFELTATNTLFLKNKNVYSGICASESRMKAEFTNCTFFRNGLYPFNKNWNPTYNGIDSFNFTRFTNCIIWEDNQPNLNLIFYNNNFPNFTVTGYSVSNSIVSHPDCSYQNETICETGVQNAVWPAFIDTVGCAAFSLAPDSPAKDSGDNAIVDQLSLLTDYAGAPRIYCGRVDLGALEVQSGCTTAVASLPATSCAFSLTGPSVLPKGSRNAFRITGLTEAPVIQLLDIRGLPYCRQLDLFGGQGIDSQVLLPPDLPAGAYILLVRDGRSGRLCSKRLLVF